MIERILPAEVATAESFSDPADGWLFPEERAAVAGAVQQRVAEFTTARGCARRALADLGLPAMLIPVTEGGAPRWPAGVVGSITHCTGYRAAAVSGDAVAIGIDAEPHAPLPADAVATVVRAEEERLLEDLSAAAPSVHWDRLVFSAKESVYKVWSTLGGGWLDFADAVVEPDVSGVFTARLLVPTPEAFRRSLTELSGKWLVTRGLVLTTIVLGERLAAVGHAPSPAAAGATTSGTRGRGRGLA